MKDKDCGRDSETGYKEAFRLCCSLRFFLNYDNLDKRVVKILSGKCLWWLFLSDLHTCTGLLAGMKRGVFLLRRSSELFWDTCYGKETQDLQFWFCFITNKVWKKQKVCADASAWEDHVQGEISSDSRMFTSIWALTWGTRTITYCSK